MLNDSKFASISNLFEILNDNQINYWLDGKTNWHVIPGRFFSEFARIKINSISFLVPK